MVSSVCSQPDVSNLADRSDDPRGPSFTRTHGMQPKTVSSSLSEMVSDINRSLPGEQEAEFQYARRQDFQHHDYDTYSRHERKFKTTKGVLVGNGSERPAPRLRRQRQKKPDVSNRDNSLPLSADLKLPAIGDGTLMTYPRSLANSRRSGVQETNTPRGPQKDARSQHHQQPRQHHSLFLRLNGTASHGEGEFPTTHVRDPHVRRQNRIRDFNGSVDSRISASVDDIGRRGSDFPRGRTYAYGDPSLRRARGSQQLQPIPKDLSMPVMNVLDGVGPEQNRMTKPATPTIRREDTFDEIAKLDLGDAFRRLRQRILQIKNVEIRRNSASLRAREQERRKKRRVLFSHHDDSSESQDSGSEEAESVGADSRFINVDYLPIQRVHKPPRSILKNKQNALEKPVRSEAPPVEVDLESPVTTSSQSPGVAVGGTPHSPRLDKRFHCSEEFAAVFQNLRKTKNDS